MPRRIRNRRERSRRATQKDQRESRYPTVRSDCVEGRTWAGMRVESSDVPSGDLRVAGNLHAKGLYPENLSSGCCDRLSFRITVEIEGGRQNNRKVLLLEPASMLQSRWLIRPTNQSRDEQTIQQQKQPNLVRHLGFRSDHVRDCVERTS